MLLEILKDKKYLLLSFILSAGLYQVGYWNTFGVNIFDYYTIMECVTSFFYPLLLSTSILLAIVLVVRGLALAIRFIQLWRQNIDEEINNELDKKSQRILTAVYTVTGISIVVMLMRIDDVSNWILIPLVSWFFFGHHILNYLVKRKFVTDDEIEIANISILLMVFMFGVGKFNGRQVFDNHSFDYIVINCKPKKVLGKAGDLFFISDLSNRRKKILTKAEFIGHDIMSYSSPPAELPEPLIKSD